MLKGRTELHVFDRGSVTGNCYCKEVILLHMCMLRDAIRADFAFMDGNAEHTGLLLFTSHGKLKMFFKWIEQRIPLV